MNNIFKNCRPIFLAVSFGVLLGCSRMPELSPLQKTRPLFEASKLRNTGTVEAEFCTQTAQQSSLRQVFLFVLDKSGSNINFPGGTPSDPTGIVRYQSLLNFLDTPTVANNSLISYGLINFSTGASIVSPLTNDHGIFRSTIVKESNPNNTTPANPMDAGWTDYLAALTLARAMIVDDMDEQRKLPNPSSTHYSIFFISDGYPIVEVIQKDKNGNDVSVVTEQSITEILTSTMTIKSLELVDSNLVDGIQLHTGYYFSGAPSSAAASLMESMAKKGGGDFYQFSGGQQISYSRFNLPNRLIKFLMNDVFVSNANTVWYQGRLVADTDGDGLADELELKLGSDPKNPDSDGNGISDKVEYYVNGRPCADGKCRPTAATSYSVCQQFVSPDSTPGHTIYIDSDKDGLNDCEETALLKTDRLYFDSNKDGIPDGLSFIRDLTFRPGQNDALLDPDFDKITNALELKFNTPLLFNNPSITGLLPYKYDLRLVSSSESEDCYHLDVTDIFTSGSNDRISVYVMEHASNIDTKQYLRRADGLLSSPNGSIYFGNGDFK